MRQEIKYTLLMSAIVLSVLFIIFGGSIYPGLFLGAGDNEGLLDMFREDLRSQGWTLRLSLIIAGCAWGGAALFYYAINSVHFDRWWNWLILGGIITLLSCRIGVGYLASRMDSFQPGLSQLYEPYTDAFMGWIAAFTFILFTLASYGMRWWSSNCRHTPLPQ